MCLLLLLSSKMKSCRRSHSCRYRQLRAKAILVVAVALLSISTSLAWVQPPVSKCSCMLKHPKPDVRFLQILSASNDEEDAGARIPFFARALQKIRKSEDNTEVVDTSPILLDTDTDEEDNTEVVDTPPILLDTVAEKEEKAFDSETDKLRALAQKTRLEAEKMDLALTLQKIDKLEQKISAINNGEKSSQTDILAETQSLMRKLNPQIIIEKTTEATQPLVKEEPKKSDSKLPEDVLEQINKDQMPVLSDDKRADAIEGFDKLPPQIKDMMARSVGMEDGSNATAVVDKLMEENRLYEGEDDEKFSMVAKADDFESIFVDMEVAEVNAFVRNLLPEVTRKEGVKQEYIDLFCAEVLGKDVFNPTGKPENIPGGVIIRGEGKVRPVEGKDYGDVLINALDKKMAQTSLVGKIQAYYLLDPTPPTGEDILNEEDEQPLILVTNADISPTTDALVKPGITFLGLVSIAIFALGSFSLNEEMMQQLSQTQDGFDGVYDLSLPLAIAIVSTQLAHEFGHLIFALKEGINIGLPTLVPGIPFGFTGSITPIRSSPKNIKSLFDFSIAGPLFGLLASIILLYNGLEMTAFMDLAGREQLPSIPVQLLRASSLGGGAIEYLLGDGILNSPNPADDLIQLHPFAIAGFSGLIINALSLLPIGNTDGGRIAVAFFGRSFARVTQGFFILSLALAGIFGADETNVLLCYAIFTQFWQKEPEVPCRNEADELDSGRGFLAIATSVLVLLILTPMN